MTTTKQPLNEMESRALKSVSEDIEMAYTTDEITANVAQALSISLNAAKGYIGQLTVKGYIQKGSYFDGIGRYKRKITQFELLD